MSQRHVSFLEFGRARPSREMVVQLTSALDVPLRQRNAHAARRRVRSGLSGEQSRRARTRTVRQAIDRMLKQQEPYPAIVVDRLWNLLQANDAANAFTVFLFQGPPPASPSGKAPNLLRWLLDPGALRPKLANWEEVARHLVSTTYAEILADGGEPKALAFIEEIMAFPDVPASFRKLRFEERPQPVLTLDYFVGGRSLSVFTTIATLGTPQDITLQEVRIECFFPADDRSDALFKSLAARPARSSSGLAEIVDVVTQALAGAETGEIVEEDLEDRLVLAERMARGVRRDQDVGHVPEWRGLIERLTLEHVEISTGQMAALQRSDHVLLDRDLAARDVDKERASRHGGEDTFVGDAARQRRGGTAQRSGNPPAATRSKDRRRR